MKTALLAGAGELPALVAARLPDRPLVAALAGFAPENLTVDLTFRLEHLGSALARLKGDGVTRICLAGRVKRPTVDPSAFDAKTQALVPQLMAALAQGDDGALRGLIAVIEEAGFDVVGVHGIASDLLPEPGILEGKITPAHEQDARRAAQIVAALGAADVGQACVVAAGQALALEAQPGTDWMLRSLLAPPASGADFTDPLGVAANWLSGPAAPKPRRDPALPAGGLLFKAPKPGQELRVDMPTIGPDTVALAAQVGLEGIVVEAGSVIVINAERCRELARRHRIFLWVRPGGGA